MIIIKTFLPFTWVLFQKHHIFALLTFLLEVCECKFDGEAGCEGEQQTRTDELHRRNSYKVGIRAKNMTTNHILDILPTFWKLSLRNPYSTGLVQAEDTPTVWKIMKYSIMFSGGSYSTIEGEGGHIVKLKGII